MSLTLVKKEETMGSSGSGTDREIANIQDYFLDAA